MSFSKILVTMLTALAFLALTSCIGEKNPARDLEVGDKVPEFSVVTSDGTVVDNISLLGGVSCIMFFNTHCPDCQKTLPQVQMIYDEYLSQGVSFILISREQGDEEVAPYWQECGYTMPYSAQKTREVYEKFAQSRIPRVYICDKNGIIKSIFTDNPVPSYSDIKLAIDSL